MKTHSKVIQILGHTLNNDNNLYYHVYGNWAARQARSNLQASKRFNNEVWYAVCNLPQQYELSKNGIRYRLFPAKTLYTLLESYHGIITTPQLMNAIAQEDPKHTILHIQGERGSILQEVLAKFGSRYPTVVQMHGYGQPIWLDWLERIWITPQEKRNFKHIAHIFVPTRTRRDYLLSIVGVPPEKISFQYTGVDFERFKPLPQKEARKKLDLPKDAFIMLYVGAMTPTKGVHRIIEAYTVLKKKYQHLYILFVGANKTDSLYKQAGAVADRLINTLDNKDIPYYYNAANVYCFYGNSKTIRYSGIGVAPCEALACNLNVISSNLIHFPDEIVDRVGYVPHNEADFIAKIEWLIQHPTFRYNARSLTEPITSDIYTTRNMLTVYNRLLHF